MKEEHNIYLPYITIMIFILLAPFIFILIINNRYYINKYYVSKKYPKQVISLEKDLDHYFRKDNYIDLRNSVKEDFNRIIVLDLTYDISDFNAKYGIEFDKLEIELSSQTLSDITMGRTEIESFQLVMFFKDDRLIRYQELDCDGPYHFPIKKSKEYKDIYIFTLADPDNSRSTLVPYVENKEMKNK